MFRRIPVLLFFLLIALPAGYYFFLVATLSHPEIPVVKVQSLAMGTEKSLPFFEVMSPLPKLDNLWILPSLEYKKGPPDRYIEKISLIFSKQGMKAKEKAIYFGRRTESNWWLSLGMHLAELPEQSQEANFIGTAIDFSTRGAFPDFSFFKGPLLKIAMLQVANEYLANSEKVLIQDQAGIPAFLFINKSSDTQQKRARAFFFRRNSQFRIDYVADKEFEILNPEEFFAKSFLVASRQDALAYVSRNLSEVQFAASEVKTISLSDTSWPLSLLAASLSIDPSSIDAYFHFAGLSGLLFKSKDLQTTDTEVVDILRNNVLSTGFYAQDVAPQSFKAAEIARLARTLTRNLE